MSEATNRSHLTDKNNRYKERILAGLSDNSVLKLEFSIFRTKVGKDANIIVMEAAEDKTCYGHWIRRIKPDAAYYPYPCGGKRKAKKLLETLQNDRGDLISNVLFIFDRDFDQNIDILHNNIIFVTDRHSIENYLVDEQVLMATLVDEFDCHLEPEVMGDIISRFKDDYACFLNHSSEINRRMYASVRGGTAIHFYQNVPITTIIRSEFGNVYDKNSNFDSIATLLTPQKVTEDDALSIEYIALNPIFHYRGKFAYEFFLKWLDSLAQHRKNSTDVFRGMARKIVDTSKFGYSNFAAKSIYPIGLDIFCYENL